MGEEAGVGGRAGHPTSAPHIAHHSPDAAQEEAAAQAREQKKEEEDNEGP